MATNGAGSTTQRAPLEPRSWIKRTSTSWTKSWSHLDLDRVTMLKMLKGALPPVIVISIYQSDAIAEIEGTVGYLAAILTVSAQCLLPRAKFMKIVFFSVISTCASAALGCAVVLCSVRARQHTTPVDASQSVREGYNSSASVISAIWLLLCIWLANALRALRPIELQDPMVAFSIFSAVTTTHTPSFLTISEGLIFVRRLLVTFLMGLAIAAAVSLFVLPMTSRKDMFAALNAYPRAIDSLFAALITYLKELQRTETGNSDAFFRQDIDSPVSSNGNKGEAIASASSVLRGLRSRIDAGLSYVMIEPAHGKLLSEDLVSVHDHVCCLDLPLAGLGVFPDIYQEFVRYRSAAQVLDGAESTENESSRHSTNKAPWNPLMSLLEERLESTGYLATLGMNAALEKLAVSNPSSSTFHKHRSLPDVEEQDSEAAGASANMARDFCTGLVEYKHRRQTLTQIRPSLNSALTVDNAYDSGTGSQSCDLQTDEHLCVFLFMEHVQNTVIEAVDGLLKFAENKVSNGSMQRNTLIIPRLDQLKLWRFTGPSARRNAGSNASTPWEARPLAAGDAEHLPPANFLQRSCNYARMIPRLLTSAESVFGFRVALASFTVAILAFLQQTQDFYTAQRLIWAMIVIVIGMKPESGASIFGYLARVVGTAVAVVLSLILWYIPDGHTGGVLVFLYLANVFAYYFWIRFPHLLGPCTISIVTLNIIVAYELQVRKLGIAEATSNGQPYYPIYLFGPYKLLCVMAGVTISFFWTIFPYPVSERTKARRALGQSLFLLANLYSCMHTSVKMWIREQQGDMDDPSSPGRRIRATERFLLSSHVELLAKIESLVFWTAYEPPIGGKFPRVVYQSAVSRLRTLATCVALMSSTTRNIHLPSTSSIIEESEARYIDSEEQWIHKLRDATSSSEFDSHVTTSLLCQLSSAISNNSALPPYLAPPKPFPLARMLRGLNTPAMPRLSIRNMTFSAFACTEVTTILVNSTLKDLTEGVKSLVGEIDFDGYAKGGEEKRD